MVLSFQYTEADVEKIAHYLELLEWMRYDNNGKVTNFDEIRVQAIKNINLMGPYLFLTPVIPILNKKGITLVFKQIIETMVPWLQQSLVIWFTDYPEEPGLIAVYPTDLTEIRKPGKAVIAAHWYTLILALALFLPTELCDYIRQNAEVNNNFLVKVTPNN